MKIIYPEKLNRFIPRTLEPLKGLVLRNNISGYQKVDEDRLGAG